MLLICSYQEHLHRSVQSQPPHLNAVNRRVQKYGDNAFFLHKWAISWLITEWVDQGACYRDIPVQQLYKRTFLHRSQVRPWDELWVCSTNWRSSELTFFLSCFHRVPRPLTSQDVLWVAITLDSIFELWPLHCVAGRRRAIFLTLHSIHIHHTFHNFQCFLAQVVTQGLLPWKLLKMTIHQRSERWTPTPKRNTHSFNHMSTQSQVLLLFIARHSVMG